MKTQTEGSTGSEHTSGPAAQGLTEATPPGAERRVQRPASPLWKQTGPAAWSVGE